MSVLSIEDIKKEIGKNIFIWPLNEDNIKGNSINLTASKFAWSLGSKKSIYEKSKNSIVIPANDTALIYTQEAIYVTNKIGGTYHSKVSLVSKGLGHIGTTLDPEYLGLSLIAVHNHSTEKYELEVGKTFVSLVFHYLKTPTYAKAHNNSPGQSSVLLEYNELKDYKDWVEENDWSKEARKLEKELLESDEYKKLKQEKMGIHRKIVRFLKNPFIKCGFVFVIAIAIAFLLKTLSEKIVVLNYIEVSVALITALLTLIIREIEKYIA